MQKVYFYGAISLDGYLSDDQDDISWLYGSETGGVSTFEDFQTKFDTMVMGRISFDVTNQLLAGEPFLPGHQKIVFSRSHSGAFEGGKYVNADPIEYVQQLQRQPGKGIWVVGGGEIVSHLAAAGLIDEWWIQITPVLLGHGKRLFEPGDYAQRLELVDMTPMGELTELHFKRK